MILFSNCLKSLDYDSMHSSSEKFEYQFARHMSEALGRHLTVLSSAINRDVGYQTQRIHLRGVRGSTRLSTLRNIFRAIRTTHVGSPSVFVFYGYDLLQLLNQLLLRAWHRTATVAFIFDTHRPAIALHSWWKRTTIEAYFRTAIALLNLLDGFLLFQDQAADELRLRKPYLLTRPGVTLGPNLYTERQSQDEFVLLYAGSLMPHNGIQHLLDAFEQCPDPRLRLRLFGTGTMIEEVVAFCFADPRAFYGGIVSQSVVSEEMKQANLLVCFRDPESYVAKFAFPSKLWECLATGVPTLANDLGFDATILESMHVVDSLDPLDIGHAIQTAASMDFEASFNLGERARACAARDANWMHITRDVADFLSSL